MNGILTSDKYFGSRQKDKIMAQRADFKTVETDLDELEEKIRKHRRKIAKRIIIVVAAVVALFLIVWLWMALRTYKSFDVKNSVEQKDKSAVSFVDFCGSVVEYSNDGIQHQTETVYGTRHLRCHRHR